MCFWKPGELNSLEGCIGRRTLAGEVEEGFFQHRAV